jgi:ribosome-associated translation inhibitor RaiA
MQPDLSMKHHPNDFERTAMPEQVPRAIKKTAGRSPTALTPVMVRAHHVSIEQHHRDYMRERLGHRLGKFAPAIERVWVRIDDVNGPKGGVDYDCRIQVSLSGLGTVIVHEQSADPIAGFDLAADKIENALQHRLGRSRLPARRRAEKQVRI